MADMGKYAFQVAPKANKVQVKEAVQKTFGVSVQDVNITMLRGKMKRYGPRYKKRPDTKKAVVTLKAGDKIQLIEGL
jgi:large subunit ribosomal protein L23